MRNVLADEMEPFEFSEQAAPDLRSELPHVLNQVFSGVVLFCAHHRALRVRAQSADWMRRKAIACTLSGKVNR
ncbi:hypothetical protein XH89_02040 [Bradyrhizobium sp. CCBAU 53340]|nr:hypothetical protein XH89_02040 [Bradyrhizobium sp. CCBAU 53340]